MVSKTRRGGARGALLHGQVVGQIINQLPKKIVNLLKKELTEQSETEAELNRVRGELDAQRQRIQQLLTEVEQKNSEIWRLNNELTLYKGRCSFFRKQQNNHDTQTTPPPAANQRTRQGGVPASPAVPATPTQQVTVHPQPGTHTHAPTTEDTGAHASAASTHSPQRAQREQPLPTKEASRVHPAPLTRPPPPTRPPPLTRPPPGDVIRGPVFTSRRGDGHVYPVSSSDSDEESNADEAGGEFQYQRDERLRNELKDAAESVIIGDSTSKHINPKRYMGRTPSFKQRASTSTIAVDMVENWNPSDKVKHAVLHVGVNDIRDGVPVEDIASNLQSSLNAMHRIFPNACIAFSEVLYIGRSDRESVQNRKIKELNTHMWRFTRNHDYIYVTHSTLQATQCRLFDDDVHINGEGGTAVLVSDIYKATGWRAKRENVHTDSDTKRVFYNRKYQQRGGRRPEVRSNQRGSQRNYTASKRNGGAADMDSMIQLLTLNMLRQYKANAE